MRQRTSDEKSARAVPPPLLELRGVRKQFGAIQALRGVGFSLRRGEVHALVGANGAGKSTLAKIVSGIHMMDSGEMQFAGKPVQIRSRRQALDFGISIVMQETSLIPDLSVAENIFLHELNRGFRLHSRNILRRAAQVLEELETADVISPRWHVGRLSLAHRQLVEIAKALTQKAELIIFDEPTASLSPREVEVLYRVIGRLTAAGKGIVYVSHRLEEIFALSDRMTILRDGLSVADGRATQSVSLQELVRLMVGKDLEQHYVSQGVGQGSQPSALRPDGSGERPLLEVQPSARGNGSNVRLQLFPGSITGLAGLVGSGRTRLALSLFGVQDPRNYDVRIDGRSVPIRSARDAVRAGLAYIPEDRGSSGLIGELNTLENILFCRLGQSSRFWVDYERALPEVEAILQRLGLSSDTLNRPIFSLSGGMQQKIVLAKWLMLKPRVMILDEPTRGIDIGTRREIYDLLGELKKTGVAILVISSDFEEILAVSDRVLVMSEGELVADLPMDGIDEEKLLMYALPRSSAAGLRRAMHQLNSLTGGPTFWCVVAEGKVFCLDATEDGEAIGLLPGRVHEVAGTEIKRALETAQQPLKNPLMVPEPSGTWQTLLLPLVTPHGQTVGVLGSCTRSDRADSFSVEQALGAVQQDIAEATQALQGLTKRRGTAAIETEGDYLERA